MSWKVPYVTLGKQFENLEDKLVEEFRRVMSRGSFILRDDVSKFEERMADYISVKHVVGVNSGTDALYLATEAAGLGKDDEVITVSHTFVAPITSIVKRGAKPVFVDIRNDYNMDVNLIEGAITEKTKAIIPVHLNGRSCEMDKIMDIADRNGLFVIEDAAQSIGSRYDGKRTGSWGLAGCFSLHPMKTLNCAGDGGFISTNDDEFAEKLKLIRNHGQANKGEYSCFGNNSRLDNLQAAILNVKLDHLDSWIDRRREIAGFYNDELSDLPLILPNGPENGKYFDTFNSYVIRTNDRDDLNTYLRDRGVETFSHLSKPVKDYSALKLNNNSLPRNEKLSSEVLSLPISPELEDSQIRYVADMVRDFY